MSAFGLVASRADAWIETVSRSPRPHARQVASLADTWIETGGTALAGYYSVSRPARTRGLKHASSLT